jgi:hypothetical protein
MTPLIVNLAMQQHLKNHNNKLLLHLEVCTTPLTIDFVGHIPVCFGLKFQLWV